MSLILGLNPKISNEEYHADREFISSSVIKTIYKSLDDYHHEYILGNKKEFGNQAALAEGSLAHSMLLEPHLVATEFRFFDGFRKAGAEFEAFLAAKPGDKRSIVSKPQKHRVEQLVEACKKHPFAMQYLTNGEPEQTICGVIDDVKIKVRFDYINVEEGYISDIKTTASGSDIDNFKFTIDKYMYHLSGALYCLLAEQHYGKKFDFYYIVLSKQDNSCAVYKTSDETRKLGELQIRQALSKLKTARETNIWTEAAGKIPQHEILCV